jgi:hypothetical protein
LRINAPLHVFEQAALLNGYYNWALAKCTSYILRRRTAHSHFDPQFAFSVFGPNNIQLKQTIHQPFSTFKLYLNFIAIYEIETHRDDFAFAGFLQHICAK